MLKRIFRIIYSCAGVLLICAPPAAATISWDAGGNTNWWFDVQNWSQTANNLLPPIQLIAERPVRTDAQINNGWNNTGEGVVYDPVNDPNFVAAAALNYTADVSSEIATTLDPQGNPYGNYGPQHIYRLYVSRNVTSKNVLTVKSGDLIIDSATIIGRSGSTNTVANEGRLVQTGGRLRFPANNLEIGNSEASGWGNGVYEYRGGKLEVARLGGVGIRVASGTGTGPSGVVRFIMNNSATPGYVRTWNFSNISYRGTADATFTEGADPNGTTRGVAYNEFHYSNGGTRPIQVLQNLTINNGTEPNTGAKLSTRLELKLDSAPSVIGGVPQDLGLFDVDFDGNGEGILTGFGDLNNDGAVNAQDHVFAHPNGLSYYSEGSEIAADFGSTRFIWRITYRGNITWADAESSVVSSLSGPNTGNDIVLMGFRTIAIPEPSALVLLTILMIGCLRRY